MQRDQYRSDIEQLKRTQSMFRERNRHEIEEEDKRIAAYLQERDEKLLQMRGDDIEKRKKEDELRDRMCSELNEIEVYSLFFLCTHYL